MIISANLNHNAEMPSSHVKTDIGELDDFIYLLSHDVRSSVRALRELPQWIREDLIEDGHKIEGSLAEHFDLMKTHMARLDQMLIDLLDYSRVGRKQSIQTIDLEDEIQSVIDAISVPAGFSVLRDWNCNTVRMGKRDIQVLLHALISNAIKHRDCDTGTVKLTSSVDGYESVLTCQDDGPGIEERHRDQVFDLMKTLRPRDEVEGSGMGLATLRKIVCHYDGQIRWVDGLNARGVGLELRIPV